MEKTRREFWNKETKAMCHSSKKSRDDIAKIVNIKWREHQAGLLVDSHACEEKAGPSSQKPATLPKNIERIKRLREELDSVNAQIDHERGGSKRKATSQELENRKKFLLSKMKKAQDAMRKNLKVKDLESKNM
jgi:hypothetical protein